MERYTKPQVPDKPKWISVKYGCPQKTVKKVRVLLSNGKLGYGRYINRERQWVSFPEEKILDNVSAWMLLPDSFQALDIEQKPQQGDIENVNYKENCNYPHIEEDNK